MPVALLVLLYAVIKVVVRVVAGVVTAGLVYYFLSNVAKPELDNLSNMVLHKVQEFSTIGGTVIQVIQYLDFYNCISLLLSASSACFALKMMSVAVRAFGINTGS